MTTTVTVSDRVTEGWRGFAGARWRERIDVRDFIQANLTPYEGDATFLSGPTDRTRAVWEKVSALFPEERRKGVLDVDAATPSTITSHAPGYIDRDRELIVGLQTDAPLKRAIMSTGGLRMVENGLRAYGYEPDPFVTKVFGTYRKTHNLPAPRPPGSRTRPHRGRPRTLQGLRRRGLLTAEAGRPRFGTSGPCPRSAPPTTLEAEPPSSRR